MNKLLRFFGLIGFLLTTWNAVGQGWEKTYNPLDTNLFTTSVVITPDLGYAMLGRNDDNFNYLFLKTDEDGNMEWFEHFDTSGHIAKALLHTQDGNLTAIGNHSTSGVFLHKMTPSGVEIWKKWITGISFTTLIQDFKEDTNGDLIYVGGSRLKTNSLGDVLWGQADLNGGLGDDNRVCVASDGNYVSTGYRFFVVGSEHKMILTKFDKDGMIIWDHFYDFTPDPAQFEIGVDVIQAADGGFLICGQASFPGVPSPRKDILILKTDENGVEEWHQLFNFTDGDLANKLIELSNGNILVTGNILLPDGTTDLVYLILDPNGNLILFKNFGGGGDDIGYDIKATADGGAIIAGSNGEVGAGGLLDMYLIKIDSLGNAFTVFLNGQLFLDDNQNCVNDDAAVDYLEGWMVQALGDETFYDFTDSDGNYSMEVDTGSYNVKIFPPNGYWDVCPEDSAIYMPNFYDTLTIDFGAQAMIDCPYLTVDVGAPFLRWAGISTYYVNYCNSGTTLAEDAMLDLTLDDDFIFLNSSIPPTSQNGQTLIYDLGDVAIGQCEQFTLKVKLDTSTTVVGQTHCIEAHITPDSLCFPPNVNWDGSSIEVSAECLGDSIIFTITNVGWGNMAAPLEYIVIEDEIILMIAPFDLNAGQSITNSFAASGSTLRLEAEQAEGHPGNSQPSVTVEGCGGNGSFSIGYVLQYPNDDADPFLEIDCRESVASFDPNDKQAFPRGYDMEHFIEANTDIEYLIRFQNTGTDTAFLVVIRDELSPWLDITTVRPGVSSHSYEFQIQNERELVFTFQNILLPDSIVNEPASHGFVKFQVSQMLDNPLETMIENEASIFFDFNEPVLTNKTFHQIGEAFILISDVESPTIPAVTLNVFPNPFSQTAQFEMKNYTYERILSLDVFDVTGKLVRQESFTSPSFIFDRQNLMEGLYFFRISGENGLILSGKMVVQ